VLKRVESKYDLSNNYFKTNPASPSQKLVTIAVDGNNKKIKEKVDKMVKIDSLLKMNYEPEEEAHRNGSRLSQNTGFNNTLKN
jgi:hypothetical protein